MRWYLSRRRGKDRRRLKRKRGLITPETRVVCERVTAPSSGPPADMRYQSVLGSLNDYLRAFSFSPHRKVHVERKLVFRI